MLSLDMRNDFEEKGYVAVKGLFDGEEVEALARAIDEALIRRRAVEDAPLGERRTLNRQFTHGFNFWEESPLARAFVTDARLCAIAMSLLGADAIRLFVDQAFFKEPRGEPTSRHQDITRWPVRGKLLTAWIALDDATEETGALAYIPGSHRVGPSSWMDLVTGREWTDAQLRLIDRAPVFVPVSRGDVLFHASCVFHLAAANNGPRRRRAFAAVFADADVSRSSSLPFPLLDWDGVGVGEKLVGPRTPIIWPRGDRAILTPPPSPPEVVDGWPSTAQAAQELG
jgi:ectoine hydroxylase-related dioxygenase (phytanoyl-CoA dioxygenase family)